MRFFYRHRRRMTLANMYSYIHTQKHQFQFPKKLFFDTTYLHESVSVLAHSRHPRATCTFGLNWMLKPNELRDVFNVCNEQVGKLHGPLEGWQSCTLNTQTGDRHSKTQHTHAYPLRGTNAKNWRLNGATRIIKWHQRSHLKVKICR